MKTIEPSTTVRQVVANFPDTRAIFLRHGEVDRPVTRFGHHEPLTNFARRRGVPLPRLLDELTAATGAPWSNARHHAERVHHGFILAALIFSLTAGAGWGGWLLWVVGFSGDFGAVRPAHIIAHGDTQLWGFVGLFILGISMRTVLRPALKRPWALWLCRALLILFVAAVCGNFAWALFPQSFAALGWMSGVALTIIATAWLLAIILVLHRHWRATWARALLAAGLWLLAWSLVTVQFRALAGAGGPDLYSMAQRSLVIELAVFGFTLNAIYAFGQKLLPGLLRLGTPQGGLIASAHWVHNLGALVLCLATAWGAPGAIAAVGSLCMLFAAGLFMLGMRGLIGRRRTSRRPEQGQLVLDLYPPHAFFWLLTSLLLLSAGYLFQSITGDAPPHAYVGAIRHALTVGFITTMIMGVGQRLLPALDHTVPFLPRLAVPAFVLLACGNLLRVTSEFATTLTPAAFFLMPFSAFLEWGALLLFACVATGTMFWKESPMRARRVSKSSSVAILLAESPWIEDKLIAGGNRYLAEVCSVPRELTIETFAKRGQVQAGELVTQLNTWLGAESAEVLRSPANGDGA